MPQPQVKAPREFKFVGGPSRKRRCRTGPGPAPRSARSAPGRPKTHLTSPQPTINVASETVIATGCTSGSGAAPAGPPENVDVASPHRPDRDPPSVSQPLSHEHEDAPSRQLANSSAASGAITTSSTAGPGTSAVAPADSTLPAAQLANHYDGIEVGSFLDWPSADQMGASSVDEIGVSTSTANFFSPFDSIFQMPFFPTPDQVLQDPVDLSEQDGFANNPISNTQVRKDVIDHAMDGIDPASAEPGHVDDQDSPAFGHGLSGAGSSDSTESIDRNDESYIPSAPLLGNISEKFSRLFEQCRSPSLRDK